MKDRRYEQGGVVSFMVVAVVLTLLLIGGVLLVKQQGQIAREKAGSQPVAVKNGELGGDSQKENEKSKQDENENQSNTAKLSGDSSATAEGANITPNSGGNSATSDSSGGSTSSGSATSTPSTGSVLPNSGPSMDGIPSTGPADFGALVLVAVLLGFGVYNYIQSQKRLRTSALK